MGMPDSSDPAGIVYWIGRQFFIECAHGFFDYRVVGADHLKGLGPCLIVSNHVSYFDPPLIGIAFEESIHFLARKTLFRNPVIGWLFRKWQAVPVDQDRPDPGSLKTMIRLLRQGRKVIVFPEGSRSLDGGLGPAQAGIGLILAKVGVPVLPVRIFGAYEALPRHRKLPQPSSITLAIGKPWQIDLTAYPETGKDLYQRLANESMAQIAELTI